MFRFWWRLPGPKTFVCWIADDLRDGKSVVVRLPQHAPEMLAEAVRDELGEHAGYYWTRIDSEHREQTHPVELLFSRFAPTAAPDTLRNPRTLVLQPEFNGKLVVVDSLRPDAWPAWRTFLSDYAIACRGCSPLDRTVFLVLTEAAAESDTPRPEALLVCRDYRAVVSQMDMLLFAYQCFRESFLGWPERDLAVQLATNLALWDPRLAMKLASVELKELLAPRTLLAELAAERGWQFKPGEVTEDDWHLGVADLVDGQERMHSLAIVRDDRRGEIDHRIWRAQVSVMLPFVEERRRELLEHLGDKLKLPYRTAQGDIIRDIRDLEIAHIDNQISKNPKLRNPDLRRLVRGLRRVRNCLAHLDLLEPEEVLHTDLRVQLNAVP